VVQDALSSSRENRSAITSRIFAANANLAERHQAEGLEIDYSSEDDYLRITIGEPRESLSIGLQDSLKAIVLYDPDTFEITALEVPFFMERLSKAGSTPEFWLLVAELIKKRSSAAAVYIPAARESRRTGEAFRDLMLANAT
jgi:hypothetical protein